MKQFMTINRQFLHEPNYENLHQNSLSLNKKYSELCDLLKRAFQHLSENKTQLSQQQQGLGQTVHGKKFKFVSQLKRFVRQFTKITREMALFQISCFELNKDNNIPQLGITYTLIQKVKENKSMNEEIEENKNTLIESYAIIKKKYQLYQQKMKDPIHYYELEVVKREQGALQGEMDKSWKIMSDCLAKREEVQEKIQFFEPYLSTFRKKLVKNKYSVLKKLVYLIKHTKNATIEIFDSLRGCAIDKRREYLRVIEDNDDDILYLKEYLRRRIAESSGLIQHYSQENKNWQKYTRESMKEVESTFEDIQSIILQLISYFNFYCDKCAEQHDLFRVLAVQVSEYFQEQQSPYPMMKELLDIQLYFNKKFTKIVAKLQQILSKLKLQKRNCKKQADILLTMIKLNKNNYKSTIQNINKDEQLVSIIDKISFFITKKNLILLYDEFINLENDLLDQFSSEKHKKKTMYDSMDISHTMRQPKTIQKKVPLKQEYWLWKEWRSEIQINFQNYNSFYKDISHQMEKTQTAISCKDSSELQRYDCIMVSHKREYQGRMQIKINSLDFINGDHFICIPWKQINSFIKQDKMFKDYVVVSTQQGNLRFKQFKISLDNIIASLSESHEKGLMGNKKKIQRKSQIKLSQGELAFIAQRKENIKAQVPDIQDYLFIQEETFSERIDQIYQLFYSDKVFNFYGKEEPCFFSYTGKKAGNYNWVASKFDKPGPQFYSGDNEVSFQNCPIFSSRTTHYNHPMKPSAIPFMPQFCLNSDIRRLYWISNEQFLYTVESLTKGVPYADTFTVTLAHRVRKEEGNTKIEVRLLIMWVKDTMMKGTIQNSIVPEVKESMEYLMNQMKKVFKLINSMENGQDILLQLQQNQSSRVLSVPPNQLNKLKKHNKILIFGLIGLVLANILFMIFF